MIDGNQDGRITSADMTTIGVHYNNDVLGGYNVYASQSLADYPDGNTAPTKANARLQARVALADTLTEPPAGVNLIALWTRLAKS